MKMIIHRLTNDKSSSIRDIFKTIQIPLIEQVNDISNDSDACSILFDDKMTILKEVFGISKNLPINSKIKDSNLIKEDLKNKAKENSNREKNFLHLENNISNDITYENLAAIKTQKDCTDNDDYSGLNLSPEKIPNSEHILDKFTFLNLKEKENLIDNNFDNNLEEKFNIIYKEEIVLLELIEKTKDENITTRNDDKKYENEKTNTYTN